jgi:hypothetical protein
VSRANGPLNDALSCDDIHISLGSDNGREVLIQALSLFAAPFKILDLGLHRSRMRRERSIRSSLKLLKVASASLPVLMCPPGNSSGAA